MIHSSDADINPVNRPFHTRVYRAPRGLAILAACLALLAAPLLSQPTVAAASTALDIGGCTAPAATSFGMTFTDIPITTARDCHIVFGSDDSIAQLRLSQADGAGAAMHSMRTSDTLDPTFDGDATMPGYPGNGVITNRVAGHNTTITASAVTPTGATVAIGRDDQSLLVMRILPNGMLDPTFDGPSGTGNGRVVMSLGCDDHAMGVAVQPDGRIIIAGYTCATPKLGFMLRLTPTGDVDTTFHGDGKVLTRDHPDATFEKVAVDRHGRIVAAGCDLGANGSCDALLVRYRNDGTLDQNFGSGGWMRDELSSALGGSPTTGWDAFQGVAVDRQGRIYGAGYAADTGGALRGIVARYSERGVRDTTWGTTGVASRPSAGTSSSQGQAVAVDARGRTLLVGQADLSGQEVPYVARFTATGALDTDFSTDGVTDLPQGADNAFFEDVTFDASGFAVAVGLLNESLSTQQALIVRLQPDGSGDPAFGTGGTLAMPRLAASPESASAVSFGADGALTVSGTITTGTDTNAAMWRFPTSATVADYTTGSNDFSTGSNGAFGACLRTVEGTATPRWSSTGSCPATSGSMWNRVPASELDGSGATVALSGSGDSSSAANLRFGVRAGATTAAGGFVAPIQVEIIAPGLSAPTSVTAPTITGLAQERRTVIGHEGTFTGSGPFSFTSQWQLCNSTGNACVDIAGATIATYQIAATDIGKTVRVKVTASNDQGSATGTSAPSAIITALNLHIIYNTGFEHGIFSTDGGGIGNELYPAPNDPQFSMPADGLSHNGSRALRIAQPDSPLSAYWSKYPTPAATTTVVRFAFMTEQQPNDSKIIDMMSMNEQLFAGIGIGADGSTGAYLSDKTDSSGSNALGTTKIVPWHWYTIDVRVDRSTTTTKFDWMIDGVAQPTITDTEPIDTLKRVTFTADKARATIRVDDFSVSNTAADYPIGPGKDVRQDVDSTVAVSASGGFSSSNDNGTSWTSINTGDLVSFSQLIDWPNQTGPGANLIRQNTTGATIEYGLTDAGEPVAPNAVTVVGSIRDSGGTTGDQNTLALTSTSGSSPIYTNVNAGATSEFDATSVIQRPGGGGSWTKQLLDNATLVVGGGATPQPAYTDGLLVESDFPAAPTASLTTAPRIIGAARSGQTLTTTDGIWGGSPAITRQWMRCDTSGLSCVDIGGASGSTFAPGPGAVGSTLRARITATTAGGNQIAVTGFTSVVASTLPAISEFSGFETGMINPLGDGLANDVYCNNATPLRCDNPAMLPVVTDDVKRSGKYALRTSGPDKSGMKFDFAGNPNVGVARVAVMFATVPTIRETVMELTTTTDDCRIWYEPGYGFNARYSASAPAPSGAYSNVPVVAMRWYVLDVRCDDTPNRPWVMDWQVDGVAMPSITETAPSGTDNIIQDLDVGHTWRGKPSGTVHYYDDVAMSSIAADYPLGYGQVQALVPDGTTTFTNPAQMRWSTSGATDCSGGTGGWTSFAAGDANVLHGRSEDLADWPPLTGAAATRWCQPNTSATPSVSFTDSTEATPPSAIKVIAATSEQATGTNRMQLEYSYDGVGSSWYNSLNGGDINPISNPPLTEYFGAANTVRGGDGQAFTPTDLDNLRVRLRATSIASGLITDGLLIEYATPTGDPAINLTPPRVVQPYSVPKVGDELSVDDGTWSGGPGSIDRAWRWQRCDVLTGLTCTFIAGAQSSRYTLTAADLGARVRVLELGDDGDGAQVAPSLATQVVSDSGSAFHFENGFETGLNNNVAPIGAPLVTSSAMPRSGRYSVHANASAGPSMDSLLSGTFSSSIVTRTYVRLDALPTGVLTAGTSLLVTGSNAAGNDGSAINVRADGSTYLSLFDDGANCATSSNGPTLVPGRWYRLEMRTFTNATTWTSDWSLGGTNGSISCAGRTSQAITKVAVGSTAAAGTLSAWFDDFGTSDQASEYPLGGVRVEPLLPDSAGIHSLPGTFVSDAGAISPFDWTRLDDLPFGSLTDYVGQTAIDPSAYLEWNMSDLTSTTASSIVNVSAAAMTHSSAAGANSLTIKSIPGAKTLDTDASTCFSGSVGGTGPTYLECKFPTPPGGWTTDDINGMRLRTGYSTAVTPIPYVDALLVEVAIRE